MKEQRPYVDVAEVRRIAEVKEIKDAFQFRDDRPGAWLQRLCLWILRRLGCFACVDTVRVERHYFGERGQRFMDRLWERRLAICGAFEMEPSRLLVGPEEYADMMSEPVSGGAFGFDAEYHVNGRYGPTVHGLHVEVIPWMRGMLLLR
jgi:hypothetical protein